MEQQPLIVRDPVKLDGYTPRFSREEVRLGLKATEHQVSGRGLRHLGLSDDDDSDPVFETSYSLHILGRTLQGAGHISKYAASDDVVVTIVNAFLDSPQWKAKEPEVCEFLMTNAKQLNQDRRYWRAVAHLEEIEKVEAKIRDMQEQVRKGRIVASMNALEVHEGRTFSHDERLRHLTEFGGEQWT